MNFNKLIAMVIATVLFLVSLSCGSNKDSDSETQQRPVEESTEFEENSSETDTLKEKKEEVVRTTIEIYDKILEDE